MSLRGRPGLQAALAVALACVAVQLLTGWQAWSAGLVDGPVEAFWWAREPGVRVRAGARSAVLVAAGEVWRLATAGLLHAGGGHLLGNVAALGVVGALWGRRASLGGLLAAFALGSVGGALLAQLAGVALGDGASGGAFAWLAALTVREARSPTESGPSARLLGAVLGLNLLVALLVPQLDAAAHLGGTLVGAALGRWPVEGRAAWGVVALWAAVVAWGLALGAT